MLLNLISIYLFITVLVSIYLAAYVQSRSNSNYTKTMMLLFIAMSFYMYGYASELNSATFAHANFWNRIEYIGIPFISALWLTIALMYKGTFFPKKHWLISLIYVIPVISFFLRFTNESHHLYFATLSYRMVGERLLLLREFGPWMYVQMIHSMIMVIIAALQFLQSFIRDKEQNRAKIRLMLGASFIAIIGLVLSIINPKDLYIDFMVICLPITAIMVIIASLKFDFLEVKTIARNVIFEGSKDAMILLNQESLIIDYNQSARTFFRAMDVTIEESLAMTLLKDHPDILESFQSEETKHFHLNHNGERHYYEVVTDPINNKGGVRLYGYLKIIRDVTETFLLNKELNRQATMDELSGLLNRREFMKRGNDLVKKRELHGGSLTFLMLDIDYFKGINDNYGHSVGDQVIALFGNLLKNNFREEDVVGRLGGEEFGVLLYGMPIAEVNRKAEAFRHRIADYNHREGDHDFKVTVSIGIANMGEETMHLDQLIRLSDKALYYAKENGRNKVIYYKDIV